ncbi:MAG: phosphomannomutase/phosphoglucomutase [Deltaproteobacteria bacterium]|nr:phosphomannomutase/phosphoglucomutase [Deltaproteobacteria bacterium]
MALFKAYDVRGVVPEELDTDLAYLIGRATAAFIGAESLAVGRDARAHSPELTEALIRGINDEGVNVYDLGLVATPMLYYAVGELSAGGGVMVTASHNPAEYNGFKICREQAIPIGEDSGLREIEALCSQRKSQKPSEKPGTIERRDIKEGYVGHALSVGGQQARFKVAMDCGNGMAGVGLEPLLKHLDLEVERLYFEPDGTFPNHEADPLKLENLADVSAAVKRIGADFGVAFDGDGDRAVFVDENGRPIASDLMTAVMARRQLVHRPGGLVLYDLRSSRAVAEEVEKAGGVADLCRVGHSFVKAQMRETGAIFAGELSGHTYFRFENGLVADDALAALVALIDVLSIEQKPLSKIVDPLRRYFASGEINRRVKDTMAVIDAVEAEHKEAPVVSRLDGLLVRYDDWWFNLRPSNTEPVLRLNLEADTEDKMVAERDRMLAKVELLGS